MGAICLTFTYWVHYNQIQTEQEIIMKNKIFETCRNCDYFVKHYVKGRTIFIPVDDCGSCNNNVPHGEVVEHLKNNSPCEYFEPFHAKKIKKETVRKVLVNMCEHLNEIEQILKEYK